MKKILVMLLVTVSLSSLIFLSACGNADNQTSYEEYYDEGSDNDTTPVEPSNPVVVEDSSGAEVLSDSSIPSLEDRKIIYRASLSINSETPEVVHNNVVTLLDSYNGYIEEANITSSRYVLTIRVLSEQFTDFIEAVKLEGNVISYSKTSEDITNEYSNLLNTKAALEAYQQRIIALIEEATFEESLELMKEQASVEAELNQINSSLTTYNSLIDYSTLTLTITEIVEQEIVLPLTTSPVIRVTNTDTTSVTFEVKNNAEYSVNYNIDLYKNGEFIKEFTRTALPDSTELFTVDDLNSNTEYKLVAVSLGADHRISNTVSNYFDTEPTFINDIGNIFSASITILFELIQYIILAIVGLLPFGIVGGSIFGGYLLIKKQLKSKK